MDYRRIKSFAKRQKVSNGAKNAILYFLKINNESFRIYYLIVKIINAK